MPLPALVILTLLLLLPACGAPAVGLLASDVRDIPGVKLSACWTFLFAHSCEDSAPIEPQVVVVRSPGDVNLRVNDRGYQSSIVSIATNDWRHPDFQRRLEFETTPWSFTLAPSASTYYIAVSARGDGRSMSVMHAVRVEGLAAP
jgi:hypothetical protein